MVIIGIFGRLFIASLVLLITIVPAGATSFTIDTTPVGDGVSNGTSIGYRNQLGWNLIVGQTFTSPGFAASVEDFTFWVDDCKDGCDLALSFTAVLQEWNAGSLGALLWQSSVNTMTNNQGNDGYEAFSFFPGVMLTPDRTYIAYLLAEVPSRGLLANGRVAMGGTPYGTPILGGSDTLGRFYEFQDKNGNGLFSWQEPSTLPSNDLAFRINVPESSSFTLTALGLVVIIARQFGSQRLVRISGYACIAWRECQSGRRKWSKVA